MASLFASQRLCNPAAVNCRDVKAVFHIAQRPLPPAASATCSSNSRDSRTAAGDRIAWGAAGCKQTVRGQSQVAYGASKTSLYTQLPDRLDEPTPGFDSIADALEDLAAGVLHRQSWFSYVCSSIHPLRGLLCMQSQSISTLLLHIAAVGGCSSTLCFLLLIPQQAQSHSVGTTTHSVSDSSCACAEVQACI